VESSAQRSTGSDPNGYDALRDYHEIGGSRSISGMSTCSTGTLHRVASAGVRNFAATPTVRDSSSGEPFPGFFSRKPGGAAQSERQLGAFLFLVAASFCRPSVRRMERPTSNEVLGNWCHLQEPVVTAIQTKTVEIRASCCAQLRHQPHCIEVEIAGCDLAASQRVDLAEVNFDGLARRRQIARRGL
jgi:hypothetical protein